MGTIVSKTQFIRLKQIEKELGTLAAMNELIQLRDGFTYGNSLVVRKANDTDFEVVPMHWEFIPVWVKTMEDVKAARKQGIPWLNATSEKLLESKMFRNAALKRRCLVIAPNFFEWRHYKADGELKEKAYPYSVSVNDKEYFFMAGIWQPWTDKESGETMDTFAIVTTKANDLMETVHNKKKRMPTILPDDIAWEWIMDDLSEERIKEISSYQLPSEQMDAYTIAKDFKQQDNPTNPFTYEELPDLDIAI